MEIFPRKLAMAAIFNEHNLTSNNWKETSLTPHKIEYINWGEEGKEWHLHYYSKDDPDGAPYMDQIWRAYKR